MGYTKQVTYKIVECWGLGLTAEETVDAIEQWRGIRIGLATVYRHRHSITGQKIIDELFRKQLRDIAQADPETRLKYRDKLLEKLIPQRVESYSMAEVRDIKLNIVRVDREIIKNEPSLAVATASRAD